MTLRSRLVLVLVPTAALVAVAMITATFSRSVEVALAWFRGGLTVGALGACAAVVVFVLDKHRWTRDAAAEAIAEAVLVKTRLAEVRREIDNDLEHLRRELYVRVEEAQREIAALGALQAAVNQGGSTSPPRHLSIAPD